MRIGQLLLQTVWLFLPAGVANLGAFFSKFLPLPPTPVDGGRVWRGKPIFGSHKTWRGLGVGLLCGLLFFWLQQWLYQFDGLRLLYLADYSRQPWTFGLALAAGAVLGDLARSFAKRRVGIEPGGTWVPFDQLDYLLGAILLLSFVYFPGWLITVLGLLIGFVIHIIVNLIGYALRLKRNRL